MSPHRGAAPPLTTAQRRLVPGERGDGGYRPLRPADGEPHLTTRQRKQATIHLTLDDLLA